jgi:hypothetical protein
MDENFLSDLVLDELKLIQAREGSDSACLAAQEAILAAVVFLSREYDTSYPRKVLKRLRKELAKV